MSVLELSTTINYEFIDDNFDECRGIVLPGGTRSSKTICIIQWLILYCRRNNYKHIVICRDTLKNLKRTTLKDFVDLCHGYGDYVAHAPNMTLNKAELIAIIGTCTIEFIGLIDDPMRVYGLKSDIFYINEVISTYQSTFNQLNQRNSEGWFLDCNPSEPNSWVYKLEQRDNVRFFRTTYQDNPFLKDDTIKEIEAYEPTPHNIEQGTADERMWSIYGKGLIFKGKEIIYPNWDTYEEDPKEFDQVLFGLDWGINHALAATKLIISGRNLYVREVIYKRGLDNLDEIGRMLLTQPEIVEGSTYVVCDNTEHRSMSSLIAMNIPCIAVKKPPGSVLDGIRMVSQYNIFVHSDSHNIQNEMNNYKWKIDTKTDSVLDIPVKLYDDACFVGDTMITTIDGQKRIEDITTNDKVLTSNGWKNVLNRWDNGVKKVNKYCLQFDMQLVSLKCTEDHKVKTDKGWIEISKLEQGMTVYLTKCLTEKSINYIRGLDTSRGMTNVCTGMSGSIITDIEEKDITSTTETRTRTTTGLRILKRLKRPNIYLSTQNKRSRIIQNSSRSFGSWELRLQRNGMEPQKVSSGIDNTQRKTILDHLTYQNETAINAKSSISPKHTTIDSAETTANHNSEETAELITSKENAQSAQTNSRSTSIEKQKLVHVNVEVCSGARVYDIHVEGIHEYFANGLLVHNCDSIRYPLYTFM